MENIEIWLDKEFSYYPVTASAWSKNPGVYIIAQLVDNAWNPSYIGECDSFQSCFSDRYTLGEAIKYGATHIHAMVEHDKAVRGLFVKKLRKAYEPFIASEKALKQFIPISSKNGSSEMADNNQNTSELGYLDVARYKLELLYEYEKQYLGLMKDYKEEIKFATALQEDLRRERSQFFTQMNKT